MSQSLAQRWAVMLRRTLETLLVPQSLIVDRKMTNAGSAPADDDETDLVAWVKRVGRFGFSSGEAAFITSENAATTVYFRPYDGGPMPKGSGGFLGIR